eukprot:13698326-Alexandrium_andersonii.AAC.1
MWTQRYARGTVSARAASPERSVRGGPAWHAQYGRKHGCARSMYAQERAGTSTLNEYGRSGS